MLYNILIFVSIILFFFYYWRNKPLDTLAKQLHNASVGVSLPFIGQSYLFRGNAEDQMKAFQKLGRLCNEKGGVLAVWQSNMLFIYVTNAEVIDFLARSCLEKEVMNYLTALFGEGSIFTKVHSWRPRRKAISPIFSQRNLRNFSSVFAYQSEVLADRLREFADKDAFPLWSYITAYALDSVCESTLGVTVDAQLHNNHPFTRSFHELTTNMSGLMFKPVIFNKKLFELYCHWTGAIKIANVMSDFVDGVIKEKREKLNRGEAPKTEKDELPHRLNVPTFVELFMESTGAGRKLTEVELREEALVLVMAASDTSAVGAAFTAILLARHPDVQDKVYEEIREVFGDTIRSVTADDLSQLKYLEAAIKESMRLYPPTPIFSREVTEDITIPTGVTLRKGCNVLIDIDGVHRNRKYWGDDADSFKPDRFEKLSLPHPAAYIPFSCGPRNCVGYRYAMMSMKTVLATLLQRYQFLPADPSALDSPHDEATNPLRVNYSVMIKEVHDFTLKLKSRQ